MSDWMVAGCDRSGVNIKYYKLLRVASLLYSCDAHSQNVDVSRNRVVHENYGASTESMRAVNIDVVTQLASMAKSNGHSL